MQLDEGFIVCSKETKEKILREQKAFKNYIFLNQRELELKLSFDVSKTAIYRLMRKYDISYSLVLECLSYLPYIEDKCYKDEALDSMVSMYHYLNEEKLLLKDDLFLFRLKQFPVTFVDPIFSKEYLRLKEQLQKLTAVKEVLTSKESYQPVIYEWNTILEECLFVFSEIKKLLQKGISLNHIYIINAGSDYQFLFQRLAKSFSMSIDFPPVIDIRSSSICKQCLENCLKYDTFEQVFSNLSQEDSLYQVLIDTINDYGLMNEAPASTVDFLMQLWKSMTYPSKKWTEAIHFVSTDFILDDNDYGFLVGFNLGLVPKIHKESGFLNDERLLKLGCSSSMERNEQDYMQVKNLILKTKNLIITYKKYAKTDEFYPSLLIQQLQLQVQHAALEFGLSKTEDDLRLASDYDLYLKFGVSSNDLQRYGLNDIAYRTYHHLYQPLDQDLLKAHFIKKPLKLAYSNMKLYYACPFSYYADRILNLSEFEPQMAARMGTFAHAVLEDSYQENFNFQESVIAHKLKNCTDAKDEFFFDQMTSVLRNLISFNQDHEAMSQLKEIRREEHIVIEKDLYCFEGYIDKLMYAIDGEHVYAAIVDYKTGKDVVSLDNMEDGFHLQLPAYMYLLSHYEPFKNLKLHIIGIYLQKVNIVLFDTKSSIEEQINKKFRLEGYTVLDLSLISMLDPTYAQSTYIKSMALGKDGFRSYTKLFHPSLQSEIISLVDHLIEQAATHIHQGDFEIAPKMIRNKNESCQFCNYKDICFADYKDVVELTYKPFDDKRGDV